VRVAIDVAKLTHQVLLELPTGKRRSLRVQNTRIEIERLVTLLRSLDCPCDVAFEPTGDYHRPLAYILGQAGCRLSLVSSLAVARTRDALYNSWDKNDPKDAQVILHLMKTGTTQRYLDPLVTGHQDLQELANTYQQVSLRKVRLQHSIVTHHLPLYFPEAERYLHSSRAEWFTDLLLFTPCPAAVRRYTKAAFVAAAREQIAGRKVDKARCDFATLIWPPLISKFGPPATLTGPCRSQRDRGGLVGQERPRGVIRRDSTGVSEWRRDDQRGVPEVGGAPAGRAAGVGRCDPAGACLPDARETGVRPGAGVH